MCGRYKLSVPFRDIVRLYNLTQGAAARFDNMPARYNIAPTQDVAVVRLNRETKERALAMLRWGLIPVWAKDIKIGDSTINAMAESVAEKPAFRAAFAARRCLVLADGLDAWLATGPKTKQPYLIRMLDQSPFAFAGLWECWRAPTKDGAKDDGAGGEAIESCTIITCPPNALGAPIHNRMQAILAPADYAAWLGETAATTEELKALLKPCPPEIMEAVKVSTKVNNVKNEGAGVLERAS